MDIGYNRYIFMDTDYITDIFRDGESVEFRIGALREKLVRKSWHRIFCGRIEFSCQISLGVEGLKVPISLCPCISEIRFKEIPSKTPYTERI